MVRDEKPLIEFQEQKTNLSGYKFQLKLEGGINCNKMGDKL